MKGTLLTRQHLLVAALVPLVLGASAPAQDDPPRREPGGEHLTGQMDPDRVRAQLERILKRLESTTERVRGAIELLQSGGSTAEAIDMLGGPLMVRSLSQAWERWGRPDPEESGNPADRWPERPQPGTPEREVSMDEVLAFLSENAPEMAARLRSVQAEDPRRAEFFSRRLMPRIAEILAAREHDAVLGDIMTRDFKVGMALAETGGQLVRARQAGEMQKAEELREQLRVLAAEQVDLRLARREHEVDALARRLEDLRAEVQAQREARDDHIDDVVERASTESRRRGSDDDRRRPSRGDRD